jgi:molybdenum cofactor cytidylyltransferase
LSTHALVLAGGEGRRFGGGKLVSDYRGRPLIAWAVAAAMATRVDRITLVLGADASEVAAALLPNDRLRMTRCSDWREGLSATLRCGLGNLPADADAVLVFLGDMPRVSSALADRLLTIVLRGAPAAIANCRGRPAHPAAFAGSLIPELLKLRGERGARAFLERVPGAVAVDIDDPGSIFDVDEPEALIALEQAS